MYIGKLRAAGLAKENSVGTLVTPPTEFIPYVAPDAFIPAIQLLESGAIYQIPDNIRLVSQGPGTLTGLKLKWHANPINLGNLLMAIFGSDNKTGPTNTSVYTHTFSRLAASQLPTYSWWFDKGAKYQQFVGCMLNKVDFNFKAKEWVDVDTEWVGLSYDDTGTSQTVSYSTVPSFKFDQVVVKVAGSEVDNYDNVKLTFDNMVKADHVLKGSIWPGKIYSEGFDVTVSMDLIVEDATEYNKFLAGTSAALQFVLTHSDNIPSSSPSTKYSLTLNVTEAHYSVASYPNAPGIIKIAFTARGVNNGTSTATAVLVNGASSAY